MQTVATMARKLGMSCDAAFTALRKLYSDLESPETPISDEQVDLLIEFDDDPETIDRRLSDKQKEEEKKAKRSERLQEGRKAAAKRKAVDGAVAAKKRSTRSKKAGATDEGGEALEDDKSAKAKSKSVAEILPPEELTNEKMAAEPPARPDAKPAEAARAKPEVREKQTPSIVIGSAIEHAQKVVEIIRADGTIVEAPEIELVEAPPLDAVVEEDEDVIGPLAEAERRQEEDERRKAKAATRVLAAKPLAKPDEAVVAEVRRKAAERTQRLAMQRTATGTPSGKTARKKQKKIEKMREEDTMRRVAAATVREYETGGMVAGGPKKRRHKRMKDDGDILGMIDAEDEVEVLDVQDGMTVEELATIMESSVNDVILELMELNVLATKNQVLGIDLVRQVAEARGYEVRAVIPEESSALAEEIDDPDLLRPRAPVITVMGHVDHGKTSLLDRVRKANVAAGEAGGITQHIAAYDVPIGDKRIVFLDTPGHEAFTQMRARGAQVTDIVVLVVAADDGVMPQTIEAIDHAKAAEVPIVVAINKIDKPNAQPERIRQELTQYNLVPEEWGGKTIMKNISAKNGEGVDELMELLSIEAEMLDLKANPDKRARGVVIESEISRGQGPVAWILVQGGTLRAGDIFLAGECSGRVRSMFNARNEAISESGPATPVVVTGFSAPPAAGDKFIVVADERVARAIAEKRAQQNKMKQAQKIRHVTLEDFHGALLAGEKNELNIILKADVQGSVDVLRSSLAKIGNEEVKVNIVHSGVGGVNESDVLLASASDAVIIGFHVTAAPKVLKLAEQEGVDIRTYRIIYEAIEAIRGALEGMLTPDSRQVIVGHVEIRQVFRSSALGNIAGSHVLDGEVQRNAPVRISRDGVIVYEGKVTSLRREKDDVRSVSQGFECGIKLERYEDIKAGDVIEVYRVEEVAKTLA